MHNDSYEFAINYLYSDTGNVYTRFEESFITLDLSLNYVFNNRLKIYRVINNILNRDNYD